VSLVERQPGNLTYRVWLMNSYFHTKQSKELLAALKSAHEYFHLEKRWGEGPCATLAASCLENELWSQSADYYKEAIPLRQRASRNRGIGDGQLSEYYSQLARAYGKLGRTGDAVDAASGAIVAWSNDINQRQHYLNRLMEVLAEAKDLDVFVGQLDAKEKESGQGVPVIRKALGKAYQARNRFDKAIVQYRAAAELQPEDFETHDLLIACYDQVNDKAGAVAATIEALQLARRNLALYQKLGDRYAALKDAKESERAYTSIVEMQANEAEAHAMLAQVRQRQDRWEEAIPHWQHAAAMRALEPTNLIELCKAQIHLKQRDKAEETLRKLDKAWPTRFDNLREQIRALRQQLPQGDK
jgi:tetratricopeptide (TPR) repeat protein